MHGAASVLTTRRSAMHDATPKPDEWRNMFVSTSRSIQVYSIYVLCLAFEITDRNMKQFLYSLLYLD